MMEKQLTEELYRSTLNKVRASAELMEKVENMSAESTGSKNKKTIRLRRAAIVAAAVIVLLAASNLVTLAATGEAWVAKIFWYDAQPKQPMENVNDFFAENSDKFGTDPDTVRRDYYGGTYVDGGTQVILLTDLSRADVFTGVGENIRFEQCDYTYDELTRAIKAIAKAQNPLWKANEGYARDVVAWGLNDRENRVFVSILHMNDKKIEWFRENILDAEYLVFENAESAAALDD